MKEFRSPGAKTFGIVSLAAMVALASCTKKASTPANDAGPVPDAGTPITDAGPPIQVTITATVNSTRFVAREHFLAAGEMQISGEPLAEDMGRLLSGYSRDHLPSNIYFDVSPLSSGPWVDLPGFSTAVESYEYSKQPMNNVGLESGAGTSLVFGPLVSPDGGGGADATARLANLVQHFSHTSNAYGKWVFPGRDVPGERRGRQQNTLGTGSGAENPLGWPGLWPTLHAFKDFDPTGEPHRGCEPLLRHQLRRRPGRDRSAGLRRLRVRLHDAQPPQSVDAGEPGDHPGADGFSAWKFGLWCLNYLQIMHDTGENAVAWVDAGLLTDAGAGVVGIPGNTVVGDDGNGNATLPGTYLGSSDIEGFQSQMFIEEMDNRAQEWLTQLTTTDGKSLTGFPTILAADSYGYDSPLQWFPGEIAVTETPDLDAGFPRPRVRAQLAQQRPARSARPGPRLLRVLCADRSEQPRCRRRPDGAGLFRRRSLPRR